MHRLVPILILTLLPAAPGAAVPRSPRADRLKLEPVEREPAEGRRPLKPEAIARLRAAVKDRPRDRAARFELVRGLMRAGQLPGALAAARAWRAVDAYNLVVVRMLGDIHGELGQPGRARRAYSAVVELLPHEPAAQRALATVLKQSGQLKMAHQRLAAAARLRPDDMRIAFELADTAQRLGATAEAERRFAAIVEHEKTPEKVRYPARQRLARLLAARRLRALKRGDRAEAGALARSIAAQGLKGGVVNDIKIYLSWDTDRTDVDLWVVNPGGEKVFYRHKQGKLGGALYDDVTSGYGPESFTARRAARGTYLVQVNYYGTRRRSFTEARGEVVVLLNEGTARERRHVLPYRLFRPKQTVTVARVRVR
jgi:tetratricopeptide (TPR) repeat protein